MSKKPLPYSHKGDLTTGSIREHLIRMSLPMVWSIFAVIAVQLTNTWFISKLGTLELAAISYTFPVTMLISHLLFGINISLSSVVSRLIGEKKIDDVRRIVLHGIMFAIAVSFITAAICYAILTPLFRSLGADDTVLPFILDYMPLWLFASVILSVPVNGNSAMRAAGDTVNPALIMISMAILNFCLDPILIYGWFGVPALGVMGAALATTIAYTYALGIGLYVLIRKKNMIATDGLHLDKIKDSLRRLIFIAIPSGIANIIGPATSAVIVSFLALHGNDAVAAFGAATRVEALSMLFVIALSLGTGPIVGQNWGAGLHARVHEVINTSIRYNFIWSFFITILLGLGAGFIAEAFSDDPEVVHYTRLFFWIVPFSYGFGNLVFGWSSSYNAMGMPKKAFVMIVAKSAITIPVAWAGGHYFGVTGILWAIALTNLLPGIAFHIICNRAMHEMESPAIAATAEISR